MTQPAMPATCPYCGALLEGRLYFCRNCSRPYQPVERVLPPEAPAYLGEAQLIQRKAPHAWTVFWTFFAVVLGSGIASAVLLEQIPEHLLLLAQIAAVAVTASIFAAIHWRWLLPQFMRIGFGRPAAWASLALLGPLLCINYFYHAVILGATRGPADPLTSAGFGLPTLTVLYAAFPAIFEEIAFRGLLQGWLEAAIRPSRAVLLASGLFMFMHFSILSAPYLFAVGLLLGWARWRTGSLYPSILLHFLHNFIVVAAFP